MGKDNELMQQDKARSPDSLWIKCTDFRLKEDQRIFEAVSSRPQVKALPHKFSATGWYLKAEFKT